MCGPYTGAVATSALATPPCVCHTTRVRFRHDGHPISLRNCRGCHSSDGAGYKVSGVSVATTQTVMKRTRYGPMETLDAKVQSTLVWLLTDDAAPSSAMPKVCDAPDGKAPDVRSHRGTQGDRRHEEWQ